MRTTSFSSTQYKFLTALALVAMVLAALPAMPAYAASITVQTTTDEVTTNGACSLREAILNANNNGSAGHPDCTGGSGEDTIILTSGSVYTLSLVGAGTSAGDLDIADIAGAGLTIQASGATPAIIDGNGTDRVLDVGAGSLTLTGITVQNGNTTGQPTLTGAGIGFGPSAPAILTLSNSTVTNNIAASTGICGAGIFNSTDATINITNSTISNNQCSQTGADGGGLYKGLGGIVNITNSTFTTNSTNKDGGAAQFSAGTANITNSTFYNNTAGNRGGAVQVSGATATIEFSTFSANAANAAGNNGGGAVQISAGSAAINRSILANSTAGKDCDQSLTGSGVFTNSLVKTNSDCTGSITSTLDPALGLLANNGGPTQTMKITGTSPAYNAASSCNSIATDQRGILRPQNGSCDLGAFEVSLPTVVSVLRASPNPASSLTVDYTVTFSEAVSGVGPSDFTLTVSGVSGANVSGLSGSGAIYTVTVTTGTGAGTIRLDVPVSATINDVDEGNGLSNLPFTTGEVYNKLSSPPGAATLVSPNGSIANGTPVYTWNETFDTSWYYLWVSKVNGDGSLTTIHTKWYDSVPSCSGGTCSVTPAGVTLTPGNYRWWIQTYNDAGYGLWSSAMNFTVPVVPPPGAATLVSPNGSIANGTPAYTWNKVNASTWYYLWVSKVNGDGSLTTIHTKWYDSVPSCGGATCSVTPAGVTLTPGNYRWWIQTYSDAGGYGAWSSAMNFTVPVVPPPGAATLVSPNGSIATSTPAYTWNKVNASTWYYLWVSKVNGDGSLTTVHTLWYDSTVVCSGATCSKTPGGVTLTPGNYRWWIQTYSDAGGYGAWSAPMNFSLP